MHEEEENNKSEASDIEECIEPTDAIHLRIALDVDCDYFITKGADLRKRIQEMINNKKISEK